MTRMLLCLPLLLWLAPMAAAQDMPLSQILIDGEGWKKVEPRKLQDVPIRRDTSLDGKVPLAYTQSNDGRTLFAGYAEGGAVWAFRLDKDDSATDGAPYCPLRVGRGEKTIAVTGLAADKDGRIYAATEIGVQVFDPTGRLCGVMASPPGKPEFLAFEEDRLILRMGDRTYARKLNATGAK